MAQATGLPPKVLKWIFYLITAPISLVVATAANGVPFPIPLAIVIMSGTTPFESDPQ